MANMEHVTGGQCDCPACCPSGWEHATPMDFFEVVARSYNFAIDVAATAENAKAPRFWDKQADALAQDWVGAARVYGGDIWCNPPYGRGIGAWLAKARAAAADGVRVVMLLPVKTDTKWWQEYVFGLPDGMPSAGTPTWAYLKMDHFDGMLLEYAGADGVTVSIWFLRGRLSFGDAAGPGRFASALVVFEPTPGAR